MARPQPGTYLEYFGNYINLVEANYASEAVSKYSGLIQSFFGALPAEKHLYSYAPGKWTLHEMLLHITDTERIFAYRALCISRGDQTPLPGFDESSYAENSRANTRDWQHLLSEFEAVRTSTDLLITSFDESQLEQTGITNNHNTSVNALAFMVYGHVLHHINIVKSRYM